MQITYLSDWLYSTDFIYALVFLTLVIWLVMKYLFHYDNLNHAVLFALLAMVMLPFVVTAAQVGSAFVMMTLIGALVISQTFKWPIGTSIMVVLVAMLAGVILLPSL